MSTTSCWHKLYMNLVYTNVMEYIIIKNISLNDLNPFKCLFNNATVGWCKGILLLLHFFI